MYKNYIFDYVISQGYVDMFPMILSFAVKKITKRNKNFATVLFSVTGVLMIIIGIFLDNQNHIIASETIFIGTVNSSTVHPREIFKLAIKYSAVKIIVLHNHPSGNPTPSNADNLFTEKLIASGKLLDIPVIDHLIIGHNSYYCYNLKQIITA